MKRVALLACCLLTACPPGARPPTPTSCRENEAPKECIPPREIGGHQGPYLEGRGLERQHFAVPGGVFPPASGTRLTAVEACGDDPHPIITVKECAAVPPGAVGAFACKIDVEGMPATGICKSHIAPRHNDPDPLHHRGVTMVRGFWDATGAWHDDAGVVTLSCDAKSNEPGVQQFAEADGAIAKCVRDFRLDPKAFGDAFLACIRMARGDYCGDGHPHTFIGTSVGVSTPRDPMAAADCADGRCFEASWSKNGAVCFARPRWTGPGMGLDACQAQFVTVGQMSCRGDPSQGIVFSRSEVNVCNGHQDEAKPCPPDADPVCAAR